MGDTLSDYREQQSKMIDTKNIWNTSFCGVPTVQAWQDFMLWEHFLNMAQPKAIIEIGTFKGGFSLFLSQQAYNRDAIFLTVDFQIYADFKSESSPLWISGLDSQFMHADVFEADFKKAFSNIIGDQANFPTVLFCDGGNKPKEMQTFVPQLRVGDFAVVHDWGTETNPPDLVGLPIETLMQSDCDRLGSMTRFFRRI